MPRLPSYQPNQIAPVELTGARFRPANNNGGAFGALGEGLQEVGGTLGWMAEEQDRLNAENDDTQARLLAAEAGSAYSAATSEYEQLKAGQARAAQGTFDERLASIRDQALSRAGTPRQRQMLEERLIGLHGASAAQIANHAVREQRAERETGFKAQEASYAELAASATDPALRDQYLASGMAVIRDRLTQMDGLDPDTTPKAFALAELDYASKVHGAVLDQMFAVPDPQIDEIMDYLGAYGDEMTSALRSDALGRLQGPLQDRQARSDADVAMGLFEPSRTETPTATVTASGAPGVVGGTLSSAGFSPAVVAGFLGNFDVEGGYHGARGDGGKAAGIAQWHPDRQANFRRVIGKPIDRASHAEQARFVVWEMNNPAQAGMTVAQRDAILAARSPEQAAELIDQHYERSSGQHREQRMAAARRYGGGYANAPREWDRAATEGALNQAAEREGWSPERTQRARAEMERRIDRDEALLQDQRAEAEEAAMTIVAERGTDFRVSMIPRDVISRMSPLQVAELRELERKAREPKEPAANSARVMELNMMRYYEPERFKSLDLRKEMGNMTSAELDTFLSTQARMRTEAPEAWSPRSGITTALTYGKKINGLDLEPENEAAILQIMESEAHQLYRQNGNKPLTDVDYQALFRSATRTVRTTTRILGFETGSNERARYELTLDMMPEAERARLTRQLQQSGLPVNDDNLLRLYRVSQR
jgi:hypothetical protein